MTDAEREAMEAEVRRQNEQSSSSDWGKNGVTS
jgi:hypothetical protein